LTINELIGIFSNLSSKRKILFLSLLAHNMTISARETYIADSIQIKEPSKLRAFNEMQHQITAQLIHILEDDPLRYPDEVLFNLLDDIARQAECIKSLDNAMVWAIKNLGA